MSEIEIQNLSDEEFNAEMFLSEGCSCRICDVCREVLRLRAKVAELEAELNKWREREASISGALTFEEVIESLEANIERLTKAHIRKAKRLEKKAKLDAAQ